MDASSPRIMTLDHRVNIGGSHAHPIISSTARRSTASPPSTCKPTCSSATTRRRPRPNSSGRCCWPPRPASPPCPTPASTRRRAIRQRPTALLATLPDYVELQRRLNAALAGHLPKALRRRLQKLAIDLTLIPYHGQPFRDLDEIYRGQAKSGTSHFHVYATAYVIRHGHRYTVALTGVKKASRSRMWSNACCARRLASVSEPG